MISSRLKNEAGGLISLGSQMKYIFSGLGSEILTKAFLIAHLQSKVTQINSYLYLSLKIRAYMKKREATVQEVGEKMSAKGLCWGTGVRPEFLCRHKKKTR